MRMPKSGREMAFKSREDVHRRLCDPAKLTPAEVRELFPWMSQITESDLRRLKAEITLQNLEAVQKFERNSSRLTWCLIVLTFVLVALTAVIARYTVHLDINLAGHWISFSNRCTLILARFAHATGH